MASLLRRRLFAFLGFRSIPLFTRTRASEGVHNVPLSHLILIADHLRHHAGVGDMHMKDRLTVRTGKIRKMGLELAALTAGLLGSQASTSTAIEGSETPAKRAVGAISRCFLGEEEGPTVSIIVRYRSSHPFPTTAGRTSHRSFEKGHLRAPGFWSLRTHAAFSR